MEEYETVIYGGGLRDAKGLVVFKVAFMEENGHCMESGNSIYFCESVVYVR